MISVKSERNQPCVLPEKYWAALFQGRSQSKKKSALNGAVSEFFSFNQYWSALETSFLRNIQRWYFYAL